MTDVAPTPDETGNAKAYSVSELAFALKRTLEDAYGFVRLRGELSKVTHHSNGHVYLTIKDERAAIDGVVWKGSVRGLGVRPEQGLEVIVTGKITTYPQGSRYQIVIESMEAAGIGALLAQLERLKGKLQGEGLFDPARKKPLPDMPAVVGVITSPTGAVIRDILHRIRDRWPCRVIVWPVVVQGEQAAAQVCAAIRGFNAMTADGPVPRPDVLIVARGGGSVEDLWAFNDETLARTVAEGVIPLISAVGHETDTTLIDFVSDRRAPTPTAAAEMATPVLAELKALVSDLGARMHRSGGRVVDERRGRIEHAERALRRVPDLLRLAEQRFDIVSGKLGAGLAKNAAVHERDLVRVASRLSPLLLQRPQQVQKERLDRLSVRLEPSIRRGLDRLSERLVGLSKLYQSVDPDRPLQRGFARVARADGSLVHAGAALASGEAVAITFGDKVTRQAVIDGAGGAVSPPVSVPKSAKPKPKVDSPPQGDLF
ncbi:MAG: exodeoxyribonuclease VII large subunit [Alphaproteobacteria bacterium]|nr:exodeoxyribonuclease VII large subunit [Alphaproteobacteria bacterium]MBU1514357.1 exodeoxyribonuclease VII large subunit [Alphaproteobacteria bacterium]MBU2096001.1 exodeoxyribonuclease VII large subunit [Alphaproteobacteria bacterium]MBU2153099.1 exodeoxyribonuclease VII large subunit [Alphaproteobacteria bacterium]MBU2308556.1 exodeoxyribonuclease VII large subunit [Alphaproteobacteria bacterium]